LKSVLSFFRFWEYSKCSRFLKSVLSFSKPQLNFQTIRMSRILLSITVNFDCSSYIYIFDIKYIYILHKAHYNPHISPRAPCFPRPCPSASRVLLLATGWAAALVPPAPREQAWQVGTRWSPPVISWFVTPIQYRYIYHKPNLLELFAAT
jgi:hypothetical protein